jgi:uncharacterized protein YjdB
MRTKYFLAFFLCLIHPMIAFAALDYTSIQPNTWVEIQVNGSTGNQSTDYANGTMPNPRQFDYSGTTFDSNHSTIISFGGGHANWSCNAVWAFDILNGGWHKISVEDCIASTTYSAATIGFCKAHVSEPSYIGIWSASSTFPASDNRPISRHTYSSVHFDPALGVMVVGGGSTWSQESSGDCPQTTADLWNDVGDSCNDGGCYHNGPADTWQFTPPSSLSGTGTWAYQGSSYSQLSATWHYNSNATTFNETWAGYDTTYNKVIALDGYGAGVYIYDPSKSFASAWSKEGTSGIPTLATDANAFTWDSKRKFLYYYNAKAQQLWAYTPSYVTGGTYTARTWTQLNNSSNQPSTLVGGSDYGASISYDSLNDIVLFIGYNAGIWIYNPSTNTWTQQSSSVQPNTSVQNPIHERLHYDPVRNVHFYVEASDSQGVNVWAYRYGGTTPSLVLTSVTVSPASAGITTGASQQLSAAPEDRNSAAFAGAAIAWSSSNTAVAAVGSSGLVTGVAAGSATITATATSGTTSVTGTSAITVTAPAPQPGPVLTSVTVTPNSAGITTGATQQLSAAPEDQNSAAFTGAAIAWSSSNTAVATVGSSGLVTGVAAGSATITATATSGTTSVTGTSAITVTASAPKPAPQPGLASVPLTVKEALPSDITGIARTSDPVTVGIPLPDSASITNINQLGLSGASKGQFRALGYWPDGNIKWVLVDFQDSVTAGGSDTSFSLTKGSGSFGGSNLAMDNGSSISIDTGTSQFSIQKANFNLFDSVVVNGASVVSQGNAGGLTMRDASNNAFTSNNDSYSTAVIEENGPVRSVVKVTGSFRNSSGTRLMDYLVRLHFYAGKSYVKGFVSMTNQQSAYLADVLFNSMDATVQLSGLGSSQTALFSRTSDTTTQTLAANTTAYLYQGYTSYRLGYDTVAACGFSNDGDWDPPIPGSCSGSGGTYTPTSTLLGFAINNNGTAVNSLGTDATQHTGDYAQLSDGTNSLTVAQKWMAAYWPADFQFTRSSGNTNVVVSLYSKYNTKTSLKFAYGAQETREIMWDFETSVLSPASNILYHLEYPLVAYAPYTQYASTGAIYGETGLVSTATEATYLSNLSYLDWGGGTTANPHTNFPFSNVYRYNPWPQGGGINETDYDMLNMIDFLRTGNGGNYLSGEQFTRFIADSAIYHSDVYPTSTITDPAPGQDPVNSEPFDEEHAHCRGVPLLYFLSGDERLKDSFIGWGPVVNWQATVTNGSGDMSFNDPYFRAVNRLYRNMALEYEFSCQTGSCNSAYITPVATFTNALMDSRTNPTFASGYSGTPRGRDMSRGYIYWDSSLDSVFGTDSNGVPNVSRDLHSFFHTQIHFEALWTVMRVMQDWYPSYNRFLDMYDYMYGLSQFFFNEYYREVANSLCMSGGTGTGTDPYTYGYFYEYGLDIAQSPVVQSGYTESCTNATYVGSYINALNPEPVSRAGVFLFQRTGNTTYLTDAGKMLGGWISWSGQIPLYTTDLDQQALIYAYFNQQQVSQALPLTVQNNGGGSYTLTWTVPSNAASYQIKYAGTPIVDWLGFDPVARTFQYDPSQYTPYFAATNASSVPQPGTPGAQQQMTITGLGSQMYFAAKSLGMSSPSSPISPPTGLRLE